LRNIRKGMFPSVGAMRAAETTVIIEDVVFPIEHLEVARSSCRPCSASTITTKPSSSAMRWRGICTSCSRPFSGDAEIKRYEAFIEDVCKLVAVEYEGAVKAEHGTGRNMAPFVEMEGRRPTASCRSSKPCSTRMAS
jgi:D-lactate dehydrogenase